MEAKMSEVILHLRVDGKSACAVCGANLDRPVSRWWLANAWTKDRRHYREQETNLPGERVRPCGALQTNVAFCSGASDPLPRAVDGQRFYVVKQHNR